MNNNTLTDLNNHLFEQMERLNDDELVPEALEIEIKRSDAMTNVATQIINNAKLAVEAEKIYSGKDGWVDPKRRPVMLEAKKDEKTEWKRVEQDKKYSVE